MNAETTRRAREHFDSLTRAEVAEAVADMMALGFGEYTCASATGLSIEAVRQILAERRESRT
ncbi:MAG: hypothetical protein WD795_00695 [Woeseia sp.]